MKKPATGYKFKVFVVAEKIAEFVEIAKNGGREKVVKNETHG